MGVCPGISFPILNGLTSAEIGVSLQAYSAALTLIAENSSGTVTADQVTAVFASLSSTPLNASNLSSGTIPNGRFPATLPAASGFNLTALNASNLGSGTVPSARLAANLALIADSGTGTLALGNAELTVASIATDEIDAVDFSSSGIFSFVAEALAGNGSFGALSITQFLSDMRTVGGAGTATLAAGTAGRCKRIMLTEDGGDLVVTVTNLQGGTTITFDDAGDCIDLQYQNSKWQVTSNNGCVVA